jgi:hypothetical protein
MLVAAADVQYCTTQPLPGSAQSPVLVLPPLVPPPLVPAAPLLPPDARPPAPLLPPEALPALLLPAEPLPELPPELVPAAALPAAPPLVLVPPNAIVTFPPLPLLPVDFPALPPPPMALAPPRPPLAPLAPAPSASKLGSTAVAHENSSPMSGQLLPAKVDWATRSPRVRAGWTGVRAQPEASGSIARLTLHAGRKIQRWCGYGSPHPPRSGTDAGISGQGPSLGESDSRILILVSGTGSGNLRDSGLAKR